MATRPVLKAGQKAYTLTVYLTDREAKRVIEVARQLSVGEARIERSPKSAKPLAR